MVKTRIIPLVSAGRRRTLTFCEGLPAQEVPQCECAMEPQPITAAEVILHSEAGNFRLAWAGFLAGYSNEKTRDAYDYDLRVWAGWCREVGIDPLEARRPHIELFVRHLEEVGLAPRTINRRLTAVRSFFRYCVDEDFALRDPTSRVKTPKVPDSPQPYLRPLDCEAFLATAEAMEPRFHALACLMLLNGLRVGEVCSLQVDSVGSHRGMTTVTFVGKGTKAATVPLAPQTTWAVERLIGDRTEGPMFLRKNGTCLDRRTAWDWVQRIAKKAGITVKVTPHALRRSAITAALDAKLPLRDVQHFARHSDPRTTAKYDQARFSMESNATFALQAYLSRGGQ